MMPGTRDLFDAYARADVLCGRDIENLAYFGVGRLVTHAHDGFAGERARDLEVHFEALVEHTIPRLRAAGISAYAALGVPARKIPWRNLEVLLARLPAWFALPEVVALSGVGLVDGGEWEEEVLRRQCLIAAELRVPIVVRAPPLSRARRLRRMLTVLREAKLDPDKVLVTGADEREALVARACGFRVTLGAMRAEDATSLVSRVGGGGLMISSEIGGGENDPSRPYRLVEAMENEGLSRAVIRRVGHGNAASFYGLSR